jgi:predicted dehydrogenase
MTPPRIALVGAGRMGKLHARVLAEMPQAVLAAVLDVNPAAAELLAGQYRARACATVAEALGACDAAIIAVPTVAHVQAAWPFVAAGKSVLIEKPLAESAAAAEKLLELAGRTGASVQVGHTERFNPAVQAIARFQIVPKFIEAHRISPYTFRSADIGVVLDMMIHDIDLVLMMVRSQLSDVQAVGVNVIGGPEDIANARLTFANGCVANLTASRLAIKSERKMRIFSEQAYLSVDYGKKVGIVIKKGDNLDLIQMARQKQARDLAELAGTVDYAKLLKVEQLQVEETQEPLRQQAMAFVECVTGGQKPPVSGQEGLEALRCAERIVEAIKSHRWDGQASPRHGLDIISRE